MHGQTFVGKPSVHCVEVSSNQIIQSNFLCNHIITLIRVEIYVFKLELAYIQIEIAKNRTSDWTLLSCRFFFRFSKRKAHFRRRVQMLKSTQRSCFPMSVLDVNYVVNSFESKERKSVGKLLFHFFLSRLFICSTRYWWMFMHSVWFSVVNCFPRMLTV